MSEHSTIEWTDSTWSPIRARLKEKIGRKAKGSLGWHCEHASEGCRNCYAEGFNRRLGTGLDFKPGHRDDVEIFLDEEMLLAPLRWKKPKIIFVCSMTDAFASFVRDEWLDRMFAVMALCPQHTFQVLTKRAERMREYINQCLNKVGRPLVAIFLSKLSTTRNSKGSAETTSNYSFGRCGNWRRGKVQA